MTAPLVLAADGGNSKTDLLLARADGQVLGLARGKLSSPHHLGLEGALAVLEELLGDAADQAGVEVGNGPVAEVAEILLAGIDFPSEEVELRAAVEERGWARRTVVGNDTFAVLRAGTERGWGVAVVCGAGINCVGVSPDGRHARFPALGPTTGDWGGGYDLGLAAVSASARSEDGRGPETSLEKAISAYFGLAGPLELAEAIHRGRIPLRRVEELPPIVFAEAGHDPVAAGIVERLADEIVTMTRVALERLDLDGRPVEVLLGGGLLRAENGRLISSIEAGLHETHPYVVVHTSTVPPIVGAGLLALDQLGAGSEAQERLRSEIVERGRRQRSVPGG
jgi:N-acetylglucosamine kinase-like BadF-type ATPase